MFLSKLPVLKTAGFGNTISGALAGLKLPITAHYSVVKSSGKYVEGSMLDLLLQGRLLRCGPLSKQSLLQPVCIGSPYLSASEAMPKDSNSGLAPAGPPARGFSGSTGSVGRGLALK